MQNETRNKQLLYTAYDCDSMAYGRKHEETTRKEVASLLGVEILKCGLYIDSEYPFLGASLDGLINDDAILEVKCPSSPRVMTPDDPYGIEKSHFGS